MIDTKLAIREPVLRAERTEIEEVPETARVEPLDAITAPLAAPLETPTIAGALPAAPFGRASLAKAVAGNAKPTDQQIRALFNFASDVAHDPKDLLQRDGALSWGQYVAQKVARPTEIFGRLLGERPALNVLVDRLGARSVAIDASARDFIPPGKRDFYRATKLLQAQLVDRSVKDISETAITLDEVRLHLPDGRTPRFAPRGFAQVWQPPAGVALSGRVTIVAPAYESSGRSGTWVADALSRQGDIVLAIDHSACGYSEGTPGTIDGESYTALMIAAMGKAEALRAGIATAERPGAIHVLGESYGGGAGLAAVTLAGNATVRGGVLPRGKIFVGLVNPFFGRFKDPLKLFEGKLALASPISPALPTRHFVTNVYHDENAKRRFDQIAELEDMHVNPRALASGEPFLQSILTGFESGALKLPRNVSVGTLISERDGLIDQAQTYRAVNALGDKVVYRELLEGVQDHGLVLRPEMMPHFVALNAAQ